MNLQLQFVPSERTRREDAEKAAKTTATEKTDAHRTDVVAKAVSAMKAAAGPREDQLSDEERELCKALADDPKQKLARLFINGQLARVGLTWLPGMEEKFNGA
jgi:hypothetical protein